MNIKLKAALEVAGGLVAIVAISAGARTILELLSNKYGSDTVVNGIIFVLMSTTAYLLVGLLYDMRVSQLEYKNKLNEMVKNK
jgi:hypothetical protein